MTGVARPSFAPDGRQVIYVEHQWDVARGEIVCVASTGFGGDRYEVARPAAAQEEADAVLTAFVGMYDGCEVHGVRRRGSQR